MSADDIKSSAIACYRLGFSIFPLQSGSKEPASMCLPTRWDRARQKNVPTWKPFQTERASIDDIGTWLLKRNHNYAVVTGAISGVSVVDPDSYEAIGWCEQLPDTPLKVRTKRGFHLYYRYAPGLPAFIYPDDMLRIEIKSDGRYVLGPGSIHPSGAVYEIIGGRLPASLDELPPFPTEFVVDRRSSKPVAGSTEYEFPDAVYAGERHAELFKLVRSFKGLGMAVEHAKEFVLLANETRCQPPLKDREFDRRGGFDGWFQRVWDQPDRPLDPIGDRVPTNFNSRTGGWL